jgi:hypothetical protein
MAKETLATLPNARSMLILLLATCKETLPALEAAANALDTDLTASVRTLIERSETELGVLTQKIKAHD